MFIEFDGMATFKVNDSLLLVGLVLTTLPPLPPSSQEASVDAVECGVSLRQRPQQQSCPPTQACPQTRPMV